MRFDASLKELQKAIKDLEKASKKAAKSKGNAGNINQNLLMNVYVQLRILALFVVNPILWR